MSRGLSNIPGAVPSDVFCVGEEEYGLLVQKMRQLVDIRERLEPLKLRYCTEKSLNCIVLEFQEIVQSIWPMSFYIIETHMMPKQALLQGLHAALTELLLAQDQFATQGRSLECSQHLLAFQNYLANILNNSVSFSLATNSISPPLLPQKAFFAHLQKYYADFLAVQNALERIKLPADSEEKYYIKQFDCIKELLHVLYALIQEISAFVNEKILLQEHIFESCYPFSIDIYYLEDQIPRIQELIGTFYSVCYSSPKRAKKISKEINYKLEAIVCSSRQVPPGLKVLLTLSHLQTEKGDHLRLIHSSKNK